jgi:hypothetical protein
MGSNDKKLNAKLLTEMLYERSPWVSETAHKMPCLPLSHAGQQTSCHPTLIAAALPHSQYIDSRYCIQPVLLEEQQLQTFTSSWTSCKS